MPRDRGGVRLPSSEPRDSGELTYAVAFQDESEDGDRDHDSQASQQVVGPVVRHFKYLDWIVMGVYSLGMLAIGWYYSRRNENSEDFLLAGRSMKALPVGLSYFATLFSTVTYLSIPGEVAAHGPMILTAILCYPCVYLIVGYVFIPFFMRMHVTSAYEILEQRLGLSVRLLGSAIFLAMRISWMAMILFGMSRIVLVPLLGLSTSATPWVAAILGILSVIYTSMGGLKAVIWTDVIQTVVLMTGVILSLIVVSSDLGGIGAWWPIAWPVDWETPKFWFDPNARLTIASLALSQFTWYICTAGSDQLAVQRYLATRDVRTARRMFLISLLCDAFVAIILVALGMALFGFYTYRPQYLPEHHTVLSGADELFPRYIVRVLPAGISGVVIAGLAAAAMSSLSSGVNSACSVISVDWVDRFQKDTLSEAGKVRFARVCSWVIGAMVVILSALATAVEGNLLELAYKVVNLCVAPLFVLFFVAMFIPRATTWSAWAGGLSSAAAAVIVAYTDLTGLSFIWIMPVSLLTGSIVGILVAALPFGKRVVCS